jgi:hypothetical protein
VLATLGKGVRWIYRWVRGKRPIAIALALILIAVPTFAALFPGLVIRTTRFRREEVMGAWVVLALFATVAAHTRESEASAIATAIHKTTGALHRSQIRSNLGVILSPDASGIPDGYRVWVYLDNGELLLPWYPEIVANRSDPRVFEYGKGATGLAFAQEKPQVVVGDGVSDGEFGLTEAQQKAFANDQVVAAVPIRLLGDPVIGVLSVISSENDGSFGTHDRRVVESGVDLLNKLAGEIGTALDGFQGEI